MLRCPCLADLLDAACHLNTLFVLLTLSPNCLPLLPFSADDTFLEFLAREFSSENLVFYQTVQLFKTHQYNLIGNTTGGASGGASGSAGSGDPLSLARRSLHHAVHHAATIFARFLTVGSLFEVNVSATIRAQ